MIRTERRLPVEPVHRPGEPLPCGTLDLRVTAGDLRWVLLGFAAVLAIALPIGYGSGYLLPPGARAAEAAAALLSVKGFVDIAKIVLFEEILFRALLFGALYNRLGLKAAVLISSVIFGAAHLIQFPLVMAVMATWAGVVFSLVYYTTRRLSTPVLVHALVVAVQFFILPQ